MPPPVAKARAPSVSRCATEGALHEFGFARRYSFMATRLKMSPFTKVPKHCTLTLAVA